MKTLNVMLSNLSGRVVPIGYEGENLYTRIRINCIEVFSEYPDATVSMVVSPPVGEMYPAVVEKSGVMVIWDITDSVLSSNGSGECQLTFTEGDVVRKSVVFGISINRSLVASGEAPEPVQEWIDKAEQTAQEIAENAAMLAKQDIVESYGEIAPAIIETASGAIASFSDGADGMLVKKMTVDVDPVQDLHGYDSPWPAGGGKNLLLPQVVNYNSQGITITQDGDMAKIVVNNATGYPFTKFGVIPESFPAGSYYLTIDKAITGIDVRIYDRTVSPAQSIKNGVGAFTIAEGHNDLTVEVAITGSVVTNGTYYLGVCVSSENTFTPYSNVCPISGWDSANVSRTGKNLFDKDNFNSINAYFGGTPPFIFVSGSAFRTVYIPCKPSTTYTVKNIGARLSIGYATKTPVAGASFEYGKPIQGGVGTITTSSDAKYLCCYVYNSTVDTLTFAEICNGLMIELGSTASAYEAYHGSEIEYAFPSSAGTVYGGSLTIHQDGTGELVVDRAETALDSLSWTTTTNRARSSGIATLVKTVSSSSVPNAIASKFKAVASNQTLTIGTFAIDTSGTLIFYYDGVETPTGQLVYELATPVTYQLTNQQVIALLKGSNNIWADTGDVALEYPADTKLYIDGKVAELQALILENISNS